MAISKPTADRVIEVFLKHLSVAKAYEIVNDLCDIPGNTSFMDSVRVLRSMLGKRLPRGVAHEDDAT